MAQKSLGYVEMVWTCPNCQAKNRGSVCYCSSCKLFRHRNRVVHDFIEILGAMRDAEQRQAAAVEVLDRFNALLNRIFR